MYFKKFLCSLFFVFSCSPLLSQYTLGDISGSLSPASEASYSNEQVDSEPVDSEPADDEISEVLPEDESGPKEFNYWHQFFKMMTILGVILGAVLTLTWLLRGYLNRRVQHINQNHLIKILEKRNLSPKSMLVLVEVNGKQFLVSDSQSGGVRLLSPFTPDEELASSTQNPPSDKQETSTFSFTQVLQNKIRQTKMSPFLKSKNIKHNH